MVFDKDVSIGKRIKDLRLRFVVILEHLSGFSARKGTNHRFNRRPHSGLALIFDPDILMYAKKE